MERLERTIQGHEKTGLHGIRELVSIGAMIVSFGNRATSDLFHGILSKQVRQLPHQITKSARYKLDILNAAQSLEDLQSPPDNRLEILRGSFSGFHSIRINNQWRIVFKWRASNAIKVQIVDYH